MRQDGEINQNKKLEDFAVLPSQMSVSYFDETQNQFLSNDLKYFRERWNMHIATADGAVNYINTL